jgi:hypothetical protein
MKFPTENPVYFNTNSAFIHLIYRNVIDSITDQISTLYITTHMGK